MRMQPDSVPQFGASPAGPSRAVDVAVVQFAPHTDKAANLAELRELARSAAETGARVVIAPEYSMFAVGRLDERVVAAAEPLDGAFTTGLRAAAREFGIHLVAGIAEQLPDAARVFNTLVVATPDGGIATTYRKVHLYDAFGFRESDVVRAGDVTDPPMFTVDGIVFGLQTCYDLRFPESSRRLAVAGAQVLAVPAQWIPGPLKEDHWTTLIRARAIENTVYLAAADQSAPRGAGNSMVVDPMGVVLTSLGERVGTGVARIRPDRLDTVRTQNPCLDLRRL